jgi:carboxypeptidase D
MKFVLAAALAYVSSALPMEGRDLVEITPESREQLDAFLLLPEFGHDDFETLTMEKILVHTTKNHREVLDAAGFKYAPAQDPAADFSTLSNYTYTSGTQDWASYCGYDCMTTRLQDISSTCGYPLESIGKTIDNRDIWVMTIGAGEPKVLMAGNIHGDETTGGQLLQRWMWETCFEPTSEQAAVSQYAVAYMPMFNADGFERNRRGNGAGFLGQDLNRDFPQPGQADSTNGRQPETVAYMNYVSSVPSLKVSLMYHGGAVVANYPYDNCYRNIPGAEDPCGAGNRPPAPTPEDEWAVEMARAYTWPVGTSCLYSDCIVNGAEWYQITGSLQDYNYFHKGIMDITLEVSGTKRPNGNQLPSFYAENYQAMYNYIETGNKF